MLAIADEQALYLLEFIDRRNLERNIEKFRNETHATIETGCTDPIRSIEKELDQYFKDGRAHFKTPVVPLGTPFQRQVWAELQKIGPGETRSYSEVANAIGKPLAVRAAAQANGANRLAIIIPCHRVIQANKEIGGYAGGLDKKRWLLAHEKKVVGVLM